MLSIANLAVNISRADRQAMGYPGVRAWGLNLLGGHAAVGVGDSRTVTLIFEPAASDDVKFREDERTRGCAYANLGATFSMTRIDGQRRTSMPAARMFDLGVQPWGDDPPFHMPVFVIAHVAREPLVKNRATAYTFVTHGIEDARAQAKAAACDKDVAIVGGTSTIQQFIKAGLVDELRIHLVLVLLGDGTRLFDRMGPGQVDLETARVIDASGATHLTFQLSIDG